MRNRQVGFTIVELLIVIVVIGILAAITIVAFNGVSDRANNTRTEDAVSKFRRALIMYATENGQYPLGGGTSACLGEASHYTSGCWNGSVSTTFNDAIRPYMSGTLPNPYNGCLMMYGSCRNGAAYSSQNINLDGAAHTWSISYLQKGAVSCQAGGQDRYSPEPCTHRNDCRSIMSRGRRSRRSRRTVSANSSSAA